MSKRRTRKQKEKAKHAFNLHLNLNSQANVNRQSLNSLSYNFDNLNVLKSPKSIGVYQELASIKADIKRSLFLTSLILASEVVIYFILK